MAVVNVYIDQNGECKSTLVDESTKHDIGEEVELDDGNKYIILSIDHREHFDYATEVNVNKIIDNKNVRRDNFGNL